MAWTNQQEMAINARNCSVIVSAAAGSGKTAVLVERIVQLLMDTDNPIRADRMVISTFTNDAASELRQRLNLRLMNEINNNPNNKHLLKQYTLLQNAKICTINAFCFDLLRDNISEQGITSDFSVLDSSIDVILSNEAINETLDKWYSEKPKETEFLYDSLCFNNDDNLIRLITEADKFLSSLALPKLWLTETIAELNKKYEETIYYKTLKKDNNKKLEYAIKLAEENLSLIDDIFDESPKGIEKAEKSKEQCEEDLLKIETAKKLNNSDNIDEIHQQKDYCTSFSKLVDVRKPLEYDIELREKYKDNRDKYKKIVSECISEYILLSDDLKLTKKIFVKLIELLDDYYEILWKKKCEKNAINFSDGERLALEILYDIDKNGSIIQSAVAKELSEYYDIIMIDEYQDSNNKQDLLFKLLSKDSRNENNNIIYGLNAFLVGDVKQSIYKFRLANPQNFIETLANSVQFSYENNAANTYIHLNKNFRSSHQVINYVNYIFGNIMSEDCGEVNYNEDEMLYFGAVQYEPEKDNNNLKTEILFIEDESNDDNYENNDDNSENETAETETENNEALCIAKKISSMLENKTTVITGIDTQRPCEPRDFCILVRKNALTKVYINELKKLGINAKGEEERSYFSSREVSVLLDVMRIIDNPLNDIAITAVLMSPMFMFSAEEMALLRSYNKDNHFYINIEEISNNENNSEISPIFIKKCIAIYGFIKSFRLLAITLSTEELIKKIYDTTDFVTVMQLYTDGDKKQANLRQLINYAKSYEESSSDIGGVSGFIRYIDTIIAAGKDFEASKISSTSDNYVSIKTMHKSKGLEYPFVFIVETSTKFRYDNPVIQMSTDNRIGFTINNHELIRRYRTIPYTQIQRKNKSDVISEEMRLFYVALTRAKQKLFISFKINDKTFKSIDKQCKILSDNKGNIKLSAMKADRISDWIWLTLIKHNKFKDIADIIGYYFNYDYDNKLSDDVFEYEYMKKESQAIFEAPESLPESDESIIKEISDIIAFRYDNILSQTPAKLSVTQIAKKVDVEKDFFSISLERPDFIEKKLKGNERGTAIHTFLQYCSFENAINDTEAEIWRLCDNGYLSEQEASIIPIEKIKAFFTSKLYNRIKNSVDVTREMKFMVALNELEFDEETTNKFHNADGMIKGIMDLVFEENGSLVLIDYKSDRTYNENLLIDKYKLQLNLYKQALEIITGKKVSEVYIYSVEMEKEILLA